MRFNITKSRAFNRKKHLRKKETPGFCDGLKYIKILILIEGF